MDDWWQVRITKEMKDWVDEFIKSPQGKKLGLTSRASVVAMAIRELIEEKTDTKKSK